ncbi:MAG: hypothetical protein M1838_002260 [Thelocarpon superellum]|nr:MAG: hypothetical protein M1838_002260 [Thelocarpon superellum]
MTYLLAPSSSSATLALPTPTVPLPDGAYIYNNGGFYPLTGAGASDSGLGAAGASIPLAVPAPESASGDDTSSGGGNDISASSSSASSPPSPPVQAIVTNATDAACQYDIKHALVEARIEIINWPEDPRGCGRGVLDNLRASCGLVLDWTCNPEDFVNGTLDNRPRDFIFFHLLWPYPIGHDCMHDALLKASGHNLSVNCIGTSSSVTLNPWFATWASGNYHLSGNGA